MKYYTQTTDGQRTEVSPTAMGYCATGDSLEMEDGHVYLTGPLFPLPLVYREDGSPLVMREKRHYGRVTTLEEFEKTNL